ncbi:class I SAM-dependent methyltransferase [Bradyrhizobium acaciae]|uniref:class I SAM-dependent methyltransferase n=1 Tax=Bradyrhizobium acaciae TaxID=2683706 RepID=UPI001E43715A|nr:class I SAM-dependent methyltransferase [Bradyrhizobium acaciae]MCC8982243.1 class I SAM-dependent methyltransferase [Bradyrhizobium acaciae]
MIESLPSRTALVASLMRALHSRSDPFPLLDDPWGDRLVFESERERMTERILARMDSDTRARALRTPATVLDEFLLNNTAFPGVVIRSRYAEDALRDATTRGISQYVLIGAGLDSFSLRRPAFSDALTIFEIDHPATQTMKIQRIQQCGMSLPPSVHFIAADLANEDLVSVLARSPFRMGEKAFFSWLGVTVYLTRDANLATLRAVATCGAPGSELVFTYVDQAEFAPDASRSPHRENARAVAQIGEPWISGFNPDEIGNDLAGVGLELVEDLDGKAIWGRYQGANTTLRQPSAGLHIALARVGAGERVGERR